MLNDLTPVLAATVGPLLILTPIIYALRPQGGRHTGLAVKRMPGWTPYDSRVRGAIAHYAAEQREPGLGAAR